MRVSWPEHHQLWLILFEWLFQSSHFAVHGGILDHAFSNLSTLHSTYVGNYGQGKQHEVDLITYLYSLWNVSRKVSLRMLPSRLRHLRTSYSPRRLNTWPNNLVSWYQLATKRWSKRARRLQKVPLRQQPSMWRLACPNGRRCVSRHLNTMFLV